MPTKNPAREKRLAAALRENLKRRKSAGRARAEVTQTQGETPTGGAARDRPDSVPKPD